MNTPPDGAIRAVVNKLFHAGYHRVETSKLYIRENNDALPQIRIKAYLGRKKKMLYLMLPEAEAEFQSRKQQRFSNLKKFGYDTEIWVFEHNLFRVIYL